MPNPLDIDLDAILNIDTDFRGVGHPETAGEWNSQECMLHQERTLPDPELGTALVVM